MCKKSYIQLQIVEKEISKIKTHMSLYLEDKWRKTVSGNKSDSKE